MHMQVERRAVTCQDIISHTRYICTPTRTIYHSLIEGKEGDGERAYVRVTTDNDATDCAVWMPNAWCSSVQLSQNNQDTENVLRLTNKGSLKIHN